MFFCLLQILIPIVCFTANVLFQVVSYRVMPKIGLLKTELSGFVFGIFGLIITEAITFLIFPISIISILSVLISNLIIYLSLSYCYFHFVNLAVTARRIRLLRDLHNSKDGMTMDEILLQYNSRDMVVNRIERLVNSGQVIYKNNRYYIGRSAMLWSAKIILIMKLLILGKKSEFD